MVISFLGSVVASERDERENRVYYMLLLIFWVVL